MAPSVGVPNHRLCNVHRVRNRLCFPPQTSQVTLDQPGCSYSHPFGVSGYGCGAGESLRRLVKIIVLSGVWRNPIKAESAFCPVLIAGYEITTDDFPSRLHNSMTFDFDVNPFYSSVIKSGCRLDQLQQPFL